MLKSSSRPVYLIPILSKRLGVLEVLISDNLYGDEVARQNILGDSSGSARIS